MGEAVSRKQYVLRLKRALLSLPNRAWGRLRVQLENGVRELSL